MSSSHICLWKSLIVIALKKNMTYSDGGVGMLSPTLLLVGRFGTQTKHDIKVVILSLTEMIDLSRLIALFV